MRTFWQGHIDVRAKAHSPCGLHRRYMPVSHSLLGLTSVRYDAAAKLAEVRAINDKLRKAIATEGRRGPVEGLWWQLSLTMRNEDEPSAVSLLRISRDRDGALNVTGRAWQEDGTLSSRYWSEAAKERRDPPASSTSGKASALGTRMPRSLRAPARSRWRPPTAPPGTGRHGQIATLG